MPFVDEEVAEQGYKMVVVSTRAATTSTPTTGKPVLKLDKEALHQQWLKQNPGGHARPATLGHKVGATPPAIKPHHRAPALRGQTFASAPAAKSPPAARAKAPAVASRGQVLARVANLAAAAAAAAAAQPLLPGGGGARGAPALATPGPAYGYGPAGTPGPGYAPHPQAYPPQLQQAYPPPQPPPHQYAQQPPPHQQYAQPTQQQYPPHQQQQQQPEPYPLHPQQQPAPHQYPPQQQQPQPQPQQPAPQQHAPAPPVPPVPPPAQGAWSEYFDQRQGGRCVRLRGAPPRRSSAALLVLPCALPCMLPRPCAAHALHRYRCVRARAPPAGEGLARHEVADGRRAPCRARQALLLQRGDGADGVGAARRLPSPSTRAGKCLHHRQRAQRRRRRPGVRLMSGAWKLGLPVRPTHSLTRAAGQPARQLGHELARRSSPCHIPSPSSVARTQRHLSTHLALPHTVPRTLPHGSSAPCQHHVSTTSAHCVTHVAPPRRSRIVSFQSVRPS